MISCIGRFFHQLLLSEKPCDIAFTLLSVFNKVLVHYSDEKLTIGN